MWTVHGMHCSVSTNMSFVLIQVDFEELVAFWLADEGVDGGVSQEVQEAVEAIMASAAQDKRAKLQAEQEHALQGAAASVDTLTAVEL